MNHSDQPSLRKYIPSRLNLDDRVSVSTNSQNFNQQEESNPYSKSSQVTHQINTGITYLPFPEPRLQLVQPQQSVDYKNQIEQDFYIRYQYINHDELNLLLSHIKEEDAHRYKTSYHHLYQSVLRSILNTIDINEEIAQTQQSILHKNEMLPILIQNHKLAKREKKILYNIATKSWHKFDECIQNEINVQYQLEQIRKEHQNLLDMKIKQEQYQRFYFKLHEIKNDITYLRKEIQQLHDYKRQLQDEIHEIKSHCSHQIIQLNFLQSHILRSHTNQLNNLQLERDSLITQTELTKYNLFEQIQQFDTIVNNYRVSLNSFRLTLSELEQQLKQQTDHELIHLQLFHSFQRQTITDDTNQLIFILENKIEEKNLINSQLGKTTETLHEKIYKQKQLLIKQENDYKAMDQIEQQLMDNINIHREMYLQLKTERRITDRQLAVQLKQYTTDDRLHHTFIQQHDSLIARKKLEEIRMTSLNERLHLLIDENHHLKTLSEQLHRQYTQITPNHLLELREEIHRLRQTHQRLIEAKLLHQSTKLSSEKKDEQLQRRNQRIADRIKHILNRMKQNDIEFQDNYKHIEKLEDQLREEQQHHLQLQCLSTEMKNRSESYRTKRHSIQMQTQVALNSIKHSQYRLKSFTEQLLIYHNDANEQQITLHKLREFYAVLKEQDEISLKKLSTVYHQSLHLQNQYKISMKALQQTKDDVTKYVTIRSVLGGMIVRRVNLCQLLYQKLARFDEHIHQREQSIQMISQYVNSLKLPIRQLRHENRKFLERRDQIQLETVKVHIDKILDDSHEKQRLLTKQIFQRHFQIKHSHNPLPLEEKSYLKNKFRLLANRLMKVICRGMVCNFVLVSIQQDFSSQLELYTAKTPRETTRNRNYLRTNLYQLMQQLKARTAENNMLIDYQYYLELMHTDIIEQTTQWENFNAMDSL